MMFALIVVVGIVALGVASFYVIKRPQGAVDQPGGGPAQAVRRLPRHPAQSLYR